MAEIFKKYCRGFAVDDLAFQCKKFSTHFFAKKVGPKLVKKKISRKCVTLKFSFFFERLKNYKHNYKSWPKM